MCCHTGLSCHRHRTWHPILSQYRYRVVSIDVEHITGIHNYPFYCLGSDPIGKSFPVLSTHAVNAHLYDAVMVVVSQKLGRKCTVPSESWTRDMWRANPICSPLGHSCFFQSVKPKMMRTLTLMLWLSFKFQCRWIAQCQIDPSSSTLQVGVLCPMYVALHSSFLIMTIFNHFYKVWQHVMT